MFFLLVLCISLLSINDVNADKNILKWSRTGKSIEVLTTNMHKSDLLSPDLKNAIREKNPKKFDELGQLSAAILFYAYIRPVTEEVEKSQETLQLGQGTLQDYLKLYQDIASYGHVVINKTGELSEAANEPTNIGFVSLFPFVSPCDAVNNIIVSIGQDMKWDNKKIEEEKKQFFAKLAILLKEKK
jgi:hypothetical protein